MAYKTQAAAGATGTATYGGGSYTVAMQRAVYQDPPPAIPTGLTGVGLSQT